MARLSSWMQSYSETDVARALLWLLIVFSALSAASLTPGLVNTSGRNARRYLATLRSPQAVERAQLEAARAAAVEGRTEKRRGGADQITEATLPVLTAGDSVTIYGGGEVEAKVRIERVCEF